MPHDPIPQLKEQLSREIIAAVDKYTWTVAAGMLGIEPSRMSHLKKGNLERFSLEKLIRMLAVIDRKVEVRIVDESGAAFRRRMTGCDRM